MRPHPTDPADRESLARAVAVQATLLRVAGAHRLAEQNVFIRAARYGLSTAAPYAEMARCLAGLRRIEDWHDVWAGPAETLERQGAAAAEARRMVTAADSYRRASAYWHVAQINLLDDDPRRVPAQRRSVAAYRRAAGWQHPPAERLDDPFPGYFRTPGPGERPAVILLNGANTSKEELHHYTDGFLARGVCTLVFDAPGQGELAARFGHPGLQVDNVPAAVGACVDYLIARREVDASRIGLWGISFGGFLALRVAAAEPRVRAAVSVSGFYDLRSFPQLSPLLHEEFRALFGLDTFAQVRAYVSTSCTLAGTVERLATPYLVVHGALDDLLDEDEARRIASGPGGELWMIPDGLHGCYNRHAEVGPAVADWLVERF